jgi:transcriptional regulator with XRE-family HTH domain
LYWIVYIITYKCTLVNHQKVSNYYRKETSVMFYEKFIRLCDDRGISPTAACTAMKISDSAWRRWKDGTGSPRRENLNKIAKFFGVTPGSLVDDGEDIVYVEDNTAARQYAFDRKDLRILFDVAPDSPPSRIYEVIALLKKYQEEDNSGD